MNPVCRQAVFKTNTMTDELDLPRSGVSSPKDEDTPKKLKIWMTVNTGMYSSGIEALSCFKAEGGNFRFQLRDFHFKIGGYAYDKIKELSFGSMDEVHLALVSVKQLGFKYPPKYKYVLGKIAMRKGIGFCTGEDFFLARLQFSDQTANSKIYVPIGPGEDKEGRRLLLRLERHHNANALAGRPEFWILEGKAELDRICELDEFFLVRLGEKEEVSISTAVASNEENQSKPDNLDPIADDI